jgi:hypothetical protein
LPQQYPEVHFRDGMHVATRSRESIVGGRRDVIERQRVLTERFEVQAEVELRVKLRGRLPPSLRN